MVVPFRVGDVQSIVCSFCTPLVDLFLEIGCPLVTFRVMTMQQAHDVMNLQSLMSLRFGCAEMYLLSKSAPHVTTGEPKQDRRGAQPNKWVLRTNVVLRSETQIGPRQPNKMGTGVFKQKRSSRGQVQKNDGEMKITTTKKCSNKSADNA